MNRVTKINIAIFSILSLTTIVISLFNYGFTENLSLMFMVLMFNFSLGLLVVLTANQIVKISKKGFRLFIFYLILVSFFYWYALSSFMHWYYGSFITVGGLFYFIVTRTYWATIIFYFSSGLIILASSLTLFYFTRHHIFEDLPKKKVNKKFIFMLILTPIFVLGLVLIIIPKEQVYEASPTLDILAQYILANTPSIGFLGNETMVGEEILNINLNTKNPNIILILLESISAEHLPIYGYERNITPNIDKLAEKSIIFNNTYSTASHSDYAQTSFLSSRYALTDPYRNFFDKNYPRVFIWDILKEQGNYSTAYISSQDDNWANMIKYYKKQNLDLYYYSLSDKSYDYGSGNARKDFDEDTINKALSLSNKTSQPFFLYLNLQATHYPYSYPENNSIFTPDKPSFETSYFNIAKGDYNASLNAYDNSIYYVDKQIGKLLTSLENNNLTNNTIIIISSDHGEILERRHQYLRHGFGVYEEEVKVPLIIYFPDSESKNINQRVRTIDVVPTVLDIAGFNLSQEFQGQVMKENQDIFLSAQNQNFKLGLIKGDIKYMMNWVSLIPEAYNLTQDPQELNNLIKTKQDERFYYSRYGYILNKWYKCQMKYYNKEKWDEVIDC